jgi:hypothetical protein
MEHRTQNPKSSLPILTCSINKGAPPKPSDEFSELDKVRYRSYKEACEKYLEVAELPTLSITNKAAKLKTAKIKVMNQINEAQKSYKEARDAYAKAIKDRNTDQITKKAKEYAAKIQEFNKLPSKLRELLTWQNYRVH